MASVAHFQKLEPAIIQSRFNTLNNNLSETSRHGTRTGFVETGSNIQRLALQNKVDLRSHHLQFYDTDTPMVATPFNGTQVTTFNLRPDGPIEDISLHVRLIADTGKLVGIHAPTPFMIRRYFWRIGNSTFEEPPMSNYYDALLLTKEEAYDSRKKAWGFGNWFEPYPLCDVHPRYFSVAESGKNAYVDVLIPMNSFWVNKQLDLAGNNLPPITLEITWAHLSSFADTALTATDLQVDPSATWLMVRTERSTRTRSGLIAEVFRRSRVHIRCILPQHVQTAAVPYQVDSTMTFDIGQNLQGLLTGLIFHLSPTLDYHTESAANEVWTVTDAATAGSQCSLGISQLGFTKPLAYNANEATTQAALDQLKPGCIDSDHIDVGTGFLSNGASTITFQGGLGSMPHGAEGRNIVTVTDIDTTSGGTAVAYNVTTPGVRKSRAFMGIPIDTALLMVDSQPGIISSRPIPHALMLEYTKEGVLNPKAIQEYDDNAYYLLPFCKNFGESYATGQLSGVMPCTNTNVQLQIKTFPAAKLPTRFTYSGSWHLHLTAYKVVEFVSTPARNGTVNQFQLNFMHPTSSV